MRLKSLAILFLVYSCANLTTLEIPVGILTEGTRVEWSDKNGHYWSTLIEKSNGLVCVEPEDFGELLSACKRERNK